MSKLTIKKNVTKIPRDHNTDADQDVLTVITPNGNIEEITNLHNDNLGHRRTTIQNAVRIGELLTREREQHPHGQWQIFVRDNLPFDERTARNYILVYENQERLFKTENVSDLILSKAYKILRTPKPQGKANSQNLPRGGSNEAHAIDVDAEVVPPLVERDQSPDVGKEPDRHDSGVAEAATAGVNGEADAVSVSPLTPVIVEKSIGNEDTATAETPRCETTLEEFLLGDSSSWVLEWNTGIITVKEVRDEILDRQRAGKDGVKDMIETEKFIIDLANLANKHSGKAPEIATESNLNNAACWIAKTIDKKFQARVR